MQLDLFDHSADVMLRNDALDALLRGDAAAASDARARLAAELADDPALAPIQRLIDALRHAAEQTSPLRSHDDLATEQALLEQQVAPAARELFGDKGAQDWLLPLWAALARRAASLPFVNGRDEHAAPLWQRAGNAAAAVAAVSGIESWRRRPLPLAWMVQASLALHGLDATWPLLAELAWLAPRRLRALLPSLHDPALQRLWRSFEDGFDDAGDDDGAAWFPAWLLCVKPALAVLLAQAEAGQNSQPEQAMRLLVQTLGYERQGRQRELLESRRRLRELHAGLFAEYMASR